MSAPSPASRWLPPIGSRNFHLLLGAIAILILGPLGGVTAAYMNFSLGFFVGGQVLAGILGSVVTYGYGPEGRHGANYMQTMAASVASMAGMGVLVQAMVWLGLEVPPTWQLFVYFLCIGMFGVGVGMLFTPVLVERLQLTFPSGLAVANILRALTDKRLLKRSIAQLGAGTGLGFAVTYWGEKLAIMKVLHLSSSALGAGMIVGARIGIPAIVGGAIGEALLPWLRRTGLLAADEPFRKIGFLVALGMIMGAAVVDLAILLVQTVERLKEQRRAPAQVATTDRRLGTKTLFAWVAVWGVGVVASGALVLDLPVGFLVFALAITFLFVLVNGISLGISDSNPISSAFVVCVVLMALLGLKDPIVGLMAAAILLVSCSVGCDMQQDRSTGFRLGSDRVIQFRYQVIGIVMGALLAVVMAKVFMQAYPVLTINAFDNPAADLGNWQSAMTYKFVGALGNLTNPNPTQSKLLALGLGLGFLTELGRKILRASRAYQGFRDGSEVGKVTDFFVDALLLPSPYASSFGGFVDFATSLWFGLGGILSSSIQTVQEVVAAKPPGEASAEDDLPEDMSTTSLAGGGLIAGESLAALAIGLAGLWATLR